MRNYSDARIRIILISVPVLIIFISIFIGRYHASVEDVIRLVGSKLFPWIEAQYQPAMETAIWNVRIPRIIVVFLSGMSLAVAGAVFQGVFHNPLVSDHVLGVSNGASFGATLALLFSMPIAVVQASAFFFGILSVTTALGLSRIYRNQSTLTLVLSGIIISGFFSSFVSFMKTIADPLNKMPTIVFWLMGSFAKVSSGDLTYAFPAMLIPVICLYLLRWQINVLAAGDESAKSLGINVNALRLALIMLCTFSAAASVAISGVVGWVGLVIPHISRILVGPDYKRLIPMCISLGGTYLLIMDNFARMLTMYEIPIGIFTALIGAPLFAYLLKKGSGWE